MEDLKGRLLACDRQERFSHGVIQVLVKLLRQMQHQLLDDPGTRQIMELNALRST